MGSDRPTPECACQRTGEPAIMHAGSCPVWRAHWDAVHLRNAERVAAGEKLLTPATPREGAPLDIAALPDWWDAQRALNGKPDASTCGAELRRALEHGVAEMRALLPADADYEQRLDAQLASKSQGVRKVRPPAPSGSLRAVAEEVLRLAECATPYPWWRALMSSDLVGDDNDHIARFGRVADCDFAASCRTSAPVLAAEVIRLEVEVERLRTDRDEWMANAECACITPDDDCDCSGCLAANARAEEDSPDGR